MKSSVGKYLSQNITEILKAQTDIKQIGTNLQACVIYGKYNPILELENFISHAILIIVQNSSKT